MREVLASLGCLGVLGDVVRPVRRHMPHVFVQPGTFAHQDVILRAVERGEDVASALRDHYAARQGQP